MIMPPTPQGTLLLGVVAGAGVELLGVTGELRKWQRACTTRRRLDLVRFLAPLLPLPATAGQWVGDVYAMRWDAGVLKSVEIEWRVHLTVSPARPPGRM